MTTNDMLRRIGSRSSAWTAGLAMLALAGCATGPTGPSMTAMPGSQRSLEQFRYDDAVCRQRALGGSASQSAAQAAITQRAYDQNYVQCMYEAGHKVPVVGAVIQPAGAYRPAPVPSAPPQAAMPPLPPPGAPPAPPAPPPGVVSGSTSNPDRAAGASSAPPPAPPPGTPPAPPRTWRGG